MLTVDDLSEAAADAREGFFAGESSPAGVRPEILASWQRSHLRGAIPDAHDLPYSPDLDPEVPLHRAAMPVLDSLAGQLDGSSAALLLADERARILERWAGTRSLERLMDATESAPGFCLDEAACGTNGLGSVLEERRAVLVTGHEHYAERFLGYSCCGAPVRDVLTGRTEGVVTLVCRWDDANGLMMPMVKQAVAAIEERLVEAAGRREQRLLGAFLAAQRGGRRPVVAVSDAALISSPAADRLLGRDQLAELWPAVTDVLANGRSGVVDLRVGGVAVTCDLQPVSEHSGLDGVVVHLVDAPGTRPVRPVARPVRALDRLAGSSPAWQRTIADAARVADSPHPVLVCGPPGAGKLAVVRAMHEPVAGGRDHRIIDASLAAIDGPDRWLRHVGDALAAPHGVVVIRHVEQLDERVAGAVAAAIDRRPGAPGARLAATATTGAPDGAPQGGLPTSLTSRFVHRLDVPPLAHRPDDIVEIAQALMRRHAGGRGRRLTKAALQVLRRCEWPGNVRQLEGVVLAVLDRRPSGDIAADDLPRHLAVRDGAAALTAMQSAERQAIVEALQATDGNKQEAALLLGIARSTLYRKLRELQIAER